MEEFEGVGQDQKDYFFLTGGIYDGSVGVDYEVGLEFSLLGLLIWSELIEEYAIGDLRIGDFEVKLIGVWIEEFEI